jgi:hypothetical protein
MITARASHVSLVSTTGKWFSLYMSDLFVSAFGAVISHSYCSTLFCVHTEYLVFVDKVLPNYDNEEAMSQCFYS